MKLNSLLAAIVTVGLVSGCSTTLPFPVSSVVPATEAKATVGSDRNGNAIVEVKVKHLAPAANLSPPAAGYVVWAETPDHRVVNLGRLAVNSRLNGKLTATTPLQEFRVLITAEDAISPAVPSGHVVLRTETFRMND